MEKIKGSISPYDDRKITRALALFEQHVDIDRMMDKVITTDATIMTPKMFEYELIRKARIFKKRIVLPEGDEERILRAVETILRRGIAHITLLGDEKKIRHKIKKLGLRMQGFDIINPAKSDLLENYAQIYCDLRKHKGMTIENARDRVTDVNYFGT